MITTNKFKLPDSVVKAVSRFAETDTGHNEIRVTRLIDAPRIRQLCVRQDAVIEDEVSDNLWALLGHAVHEVMRKYGDTTEKELRADCNGYTITGHVDLITNEGCIHDYKCTSAWSFILGKEDVKPEWEAQLNVYAWLCRKNGIEVKKLQIDAILRDYSQTQKERQPDYPDCPFIVKKVRLWTLEEQDKYVSERVALHKAAEIRDDKELEDCTIQERWERAATFAVKKVGRKTAVKLFDTLEDANKFISEASDSRDLTIEERPGKSVRCLSYCPARKVCNLQIAHTGGF